MAHAYSIASAPYETEEQGHLELYVILETGADGTPGRLTESMFRMDPAGDNRVTYYDAIKGEFTLDRRANGFESVVFVGTGTGLAPFMSVVRDPEVYERFEKVVLVHGCRQVAELAYADAIQRELPRNEFFGEQVARQLLYYPTVTREAFRHQGRIPSLLESGRIGHDLGLHPIDAQHDRFMLCGSPQMLKDTRTVLEKLGLAEGNMSTPGHYVIERAFVDK